jgi:hypothetical protein
MCAENGEGGEQLLSRKQTTNAGEDGSGGGEMNPCTVWVGM